MRKTVAVAAALAALGSTAAVAGAAQPAAPKAPTTQAATRQYEGTIVSVNRSARTFRLRDSERGTVTVKVTSNTRFQRVGGFAGLRAGMTRIEANVRRSNGAWVATFVERSGGGGSHGGGNGGGSDD
jgi:hypothetical protein